MKKSDSLKIIMFLTALLHLAIVLIVMQFLPDKISMHYDFNMNIDRWGSKYEMLILPAVNFIETLFMYGTSVFIAKHENGESSRKVILITGILINLFFTAMTVYTLIMDFSAIDENSSTGIGFGKFTSILAGIVIAAIGNFIPKCKINSVVGLRTKWSMANEDIWFKCQRFGGVFIFFCGTAMAVSSALLETDIQIITAVVCIANFMTATLIFSTKIIHDKEK
ncbi:MAG: SdpI family protein [Ruminococcus sp.]|nr:SdpI family protein [Ruminococcus sp.]